MRQRFVATISTGTHNGDRASAARVLRARVAPRFGGIVAEHVRVESAHRVDTCASDRRRNVRSPSTDYYGRHRTRRHGTGQRNRLQRRLVQDPTIVIDQYQYRPAHARPISSSKSTTADAAPAPSPSMTVCTTCSVGVARAVVVKLPCAVTACSWATSAFLDRNRPGKVA